jgi:hypothetical protein
VLALLLVVAIGLAAGCAPKTPDTGTPNKGLQISAMVKENATSSGYDAVPVLWNVTQNTLQSSGASVLHVDDQDQGYGLSWSSGSPPLAVERWSNSNRLTPVAAKELTILVPPTGMQQSSGSDGFRARWYAPEENAFVTYGITPDGTGVTITEQSLASGSKAQTLAVPVPSGLTQPDVLYGSGSIAKGFVLLEAPEAKGVFTKPLLLWLLRLNKGIATWVQCGDASAFNGGFYSGQDPSFVRVGSLIYFTHGHGKIGCIDTATAAPSVTLPEKINALLQKLYQQGPTDAEGPLQAHLASDKGVLIIGYPDAGWNELYYAVDASGTALGNLRATKTSVTSFDAQGRQGFSLPFKDTQWTVLFPSIDLFESSR